jgi:hypothetical protein
MSFREKAQIVVVSAAIALALSAGLYYFLAGPSQGPGRILNPNDDQPIIMAGGSFYIGTGFTAKFRPAKSDDGSLYYTERYQVFRIDVLDKDDKNSMQDVDQSQGEGSIVMEYCGNAQCNNNQKDIVTMAFFNNPAAQKVITITNDTTNNKPISKARRMLPSLRTHRRKQWTLLTVTVKVVGEQDKTYKCESESECEVEVHTCLAGYTCSI